MNPESGLTVENSEGVQRIQKVKRSLRIGRSRLFNARGLKPFMIVGNPDRTWHDPAM